MKRLLFAVVALVVVVGVTYRLAFQEDPKSSSDPDVVAAARLEVIRPLAAEGDAKAQYELAGHYFEGLGVDRDPRQAADLYAKAADQGHADAHHALGRMSETGDGLSQDYVAAAKHYRLATGLGGGADAQFALGQLYFHGRGIAHDYGDAIEWYTKAANQGHAAAQYLLGAMYAEGWGVDRDPIEAYKWYSLAIPDAQQAMAIDLSYDPVSGRRKLTAKMTQYQIGRGEERTRDWRPVARTENLFREGANFFGAAGAEAVREKREKEVVAPVSYVNVMLRPLAAPVLGAKQRTLSVVPVIKVPKGGEAAVCGLSPRLRDAILQSLSGDPIVVRERRFDLRGVEARLIEPVRRALGGSPVESVSVAPENPASGGPVFTGLRPENLMGCDEVDAQTGD